MARIIPLLLSSISFSCACSNGLDSRARDYLALARAWDAHDPGYVDSYYGPDASVPALDAATIYGRAVALRNALRDVPGTRAAKLHRLVASLAGRIDVAEGRIHRFDEDARAVIGVVPPRLEVAEENGPTTAVGPETAAAADRLVVSRELIATVLEAALAECRKRTVARFDLPAEESVRIELVHGRPWAAYHHYEGGYQSSVAFNLDFPLYVDRAVDEMCHEAYPGHHAQQVLMERHLVEERGLIEYTLLPSYGPIPFVAEGAASYASSLLFPDDERLRFEREVLFPLAGLDPAAAEAQAASRRARKARDPLILEAARRNLDGEVDIYNAALWLEKRGVVHPRAALEYAWLVRSHLAAYTYAETLVRRHVEGSESPYDALTELWTTPLFPEEL